MGSMSSAELSAEEANTSSKAYHPGAAKKEAAKKRKAAAKRAIMKHKIALITKKKKAEAE